MASFYAELHVADHAYPVRTCTYEFTQATDARGRVAAKVRHGLVQLTLDVPHDGVLLDWASTPYKPLAGLVVFRDAKGGPVLETLSWEAGECVGYQEEFRSGDAEQGAYVCHLRIVALKLAMQPGVPGAYVASAPSEYSNPQQALLNPLPLVVSPVTPPLEELVLPTVEEVAAAVGEKALEGLAAIASAALLPVALTLALILGSTTPAQAPGIPQHLPPVNPDELRLRELVAKHAASTLTSEEEAELIALLAKVKGIRINSLKDLADTNAATFPLKNLKVPLRNFTYLHNFAYTKRLKADKDALRRKFDSSGRAAFLNDLASDSAKMDRMKSLGLTDTDLARIKEGKCPKGYQVHHKLSLDDGGDNQFDNLVLIKDEPYHQAITAYQNSSTSALQPGQTQILDWPTVNDYFYPNF